jgi:hypothetical protein
MLLGTGKNYGCFRLDLVLSHSHFVLFGCLKAPDMILAVSYRGALVLPPVEPSSARLRLGWRICSSRTVIGACAGHIVLQQTGPHTEAHTAAQLNYRSLAALHNWAHTAPACCITYWQACRTSSSALRRRTSAGASVHRAGESACSSLTTQGLAPPAGAGWARLAYSCGRVKRA